MGDSAIVKIFDTTLCDGEQSPGATMTLDEKLEDADQLMRLNVDTIEAGFPAASSSDFASVKEIARRLPGVAVAGLARANSTDIDAAWEAIHEAEQPVIHVFFATSELYLHSLKMSGEEALQQIRAMIAYARNLCPAVEFSAEDATRSDWDYLSRVFATAIKAGATTINVPDTSGYTLPQEYEALFGYLRERVPGVEDVTLSAHCHNDLGLATANTLAAIRAGARQVEVAINGLGERAGNTALEEIVMALRTHSESFGNVDTRVHMQELLATSQLVSRLTSIPVQPNKAVVGANAFVHEDSISEDGVLKNRLTYDMMTPQSIDWSGTHRVLGKHSGRHALDVRLRQLGHRLNAQELKNAYQRFVAMADQKKYVSDADLAYIVECCIETPAAI
jgi:2-isopropylmalate synthase